MADAHASVQSGRSVDSQGSFIWYELITPDPDASKRFYDAVVGWTIEAQPSGAMDYRMIGRNDGGHAGGVMRMTEDMQRRGSRPCWLGYLHVSDVDAAVRAVQDDGGSSFMPPWDIPGVGRIAMVADPDGAPFYVMTPTPPAGQPNAVSDVFSMDRPQHVRWNELAAADDDRAIDFYGRHFGWRQEGAMDMGEMGQYRFLYRGDTMIGAVSPKPPQMPQAAWTFYFGVDDIGRAAKALANEGGRIVMGPMEIPGGEYSLDAFDPQGAHFGLVGPRR